MKQFFKIFLSIIFAAVFMWLAFKAVSMEEFLEQAKGADFFWLWLYIPLTLGSHFFRAERWRLLIHSREKPHRITLFSGVMFAYALNIPVPRLGEVTRPIYVARQSGIDAGQLIGTIVLERIIDFISLLAFLGYVFFFMLGDSEILAQIVPDEMMQQDVWIGKIVWILGTLAAGFAIIWLSYQMLKKLSGKDGKAGKFAHKMLHLFRTMLEGLLAVKKLKEWPLFMVYTVLIWVSYVLMIYVPLSMFDLHTAYSIGFSDALVITMIASIGIVIPAPGGIGTFHFFTTQTLFLLYSVPETTGLAFATITHTASMIIIVLATVILLPIDKYISLKHPANQKEAL